MLFSLFDCIAVAVNQGMFSTTGDTMSTVGEGYIISTLRELSTSGDIMINVGEDHWENN